jgi:hypothetical protein
VGDAKGPGASAKHWLGYGCLAGVCVGWRRIFLSFAVVTDARNEAGRGVAAICGGRVADCQFGSATASGRSRRLCRRVGRQAHDHTTWACAGINHTAGRGGIRPASMSEMENRVGMLDDFRVRGDVFMDGLLKVLHWHAVKGIKLNVAQIHISIPFVKVGRLVQERRLSTRQGSSTVTVDVLDIPEVMIAGFRAYLNELPGFDPMPGDRQSSNVSRRVHVHVVLSLRKDRESYPV